MVSPVVLVALHAAAVVLRVIYVAHVRVVAVVVVVAVAVGAIMPAVELLFVARRLLLSASVGLQVRGHLLDDRLCICDGDPVPVEDRHVEEAAVARAGQVPRGVPAGGRCRLVRLITEDCGRNRRWTRVNGFAKK